MKKRTPYSQNRLKGQKGFALISVYLATIVVLIVSSAAFSSVFSESRHIEHEITRARAYAAAEAGLQKALAQVAQPATAFMGFINTARIPFSGTQSFQSTTGTLVGSFFVTFNYPNQADWVVLSATATVNGETRKLEGRVFLQSNLSKYLMYANSTTVGLGNNLVLGTSDGVSPQGVPANANDRAALYYTNDLDFSGSNINIYGDTHAENFISGSNSNTIHGDTYVGGFAWDSLGRVTNDGINGTLTVGDGFSDDIDRDKNGTINANDYADRHDLLKAPDEMKVYNQDARREEVLDTINLDFYQTNNSSVAATRGYGTTTAERYFVFTPNAAGTQTNVAVYNTQAKYNTAKVSDQVDAFTLPAGAILYNKGRAHVKGAIAGRVAVVSSDDILFDGNVRYAGNNSYCSAQNSAAFLAKDQIFFRPESLEVSGIIYADKTDSHTGNLAIDSDYNVNGQVRPQDKANGHFRHFGNLIIDGTGNTSNYTNDRAYVYDPNLKYYRPPGLPVEPELRMVREI
jgi:type II secretory pathway pseudopilin PulG